MTLHMSLPLGTTTAFELPKCVLYDGISVLQLTFILIEDEDWSTEDIYWSATPLPLFILCKKFGKCLMIVYMYLWL